MLKRYSDPAKRLRALGRVRWLARFLDSAVLIPGTSQRVGFDALIGLLPGAGDAISGALAAYIVYESVRLGASGKTVAKMLGFVALDFAIGAVPVAGDVADMFLRVNRRNLDLLENDLLRAGFRSEAGGAGGADAGEAGGVSGVVSGAASDVTPESGREDVGGSESDAVGRRRVVNTAGG
jgi:hypothetical protein